MAQWKSNPFFLRDACIEFINVAAFNGRMKELVKKHWPPFKWVNGKCVENSELLKKLVNLIEGSDANLVLDSRAQDSEASDYDSE